MTVRPARPDDLPAVVAVEADAMGPDAWSAEGVAAELDGPTRHICVAEVDAHVVGYAVLLVAGDAADVTRVSVAPTARRRGIGRELLDALVAEAARRGCERTLLEVRADNSAALALYTAGGFAEIDRRRGYYADGTDAVVMMRARADTH